jgi:hypothetical protein
MSIPFSTIVVGAFRRAVTMACIATVCDSSTGTRDPLRRHLLHSHRNVQKILRFHLLSESATALHFAGPTVLSSSHHRIDHGLKYFI